MSYFKTDRPYKLYKNSGNNINNNSSNDLADLISEKFRQLGIAIDLLEEKGHLEEYKKRIFVNGDRPPVEGYKPT